MKHLSIFKLFIAAISIISFIGCTKSKESKGPGSFPPPELKEQNITRNGCLNVEALQNLFRADSRAYPALSVTTDYKPDSDFTSTKTLFHTNAAFDVRDTATSNIFILNQPVQSDCSTVQARTVSGELLTFKITRSSLTSISLSLQKPDESSELSTYRREGLEKKFQPIRYEIEVLGNTHLRVLTTFKSFDAHCRSKNIVIASIQNDYFWDFANSGIPSQVNVAENFYNTFLSSLKADSVVNPDPVPTNPEPTPEEPIPTPENPENPENPTPLPPVPGADVVPADIPAGYVSVSVADLKNLKAKDLREDVKKCTY